MSAYLDLDDCVAGNPQAAAELKQLKTSSDSWRNTAKTSYKRVMELSAELDEANKRIQELEMLAEHRKGDYDELLEISDKELDEMRAQFEYLKKWMSQDNSMLDINKVSEALVRMCDDILAKYPGGEK